MNTLSTILQRIKQQTVEGSDSTNDSLNTTVRPAGLDDGYRMAVGRLISTLRNSSMRAQQTSEQRSVWNEVKRRSRMRDKVYEWEDKQMDSGIQSHPILSAARWLKQGRRYT